MADIRDDEILAAMEKLVAAAFAAIKANTVDEEQIALIDLVSPTYEAKRVIDRIKGE